MGLSQQPLGWAWPSLLYNFLRAGSCSFICCPGRPAFPFVRFVAGSRPKRHFWFRTYQWRHSDIGMSLTAPRKRHSHDVSFRCFFFFLHHGSVVFVAVVMMVWRRRTKFSSWWNERYMTFIHLHAVTTVQHTVTGRTFRPFHDAISCKHCFDDSASFRIPVAHVFQSISQSPVCNIAL